MAVNAGSLIKLTKYNAAAGAQIDMICHHDEVVKFDSIAITQNDRLLFSILLFFQIYNKVTFHFFLNSCPNYSNIQRNLSSFIGHIVFTSFHQRFAPL